MDDVTSDHRQRVRQRVSTQGLEGFQDYEILEYLLFSFIPRKDTKPIAKALIAMCGSLNAVFDSTPQLLQTAPNMTANACLFLTSLPQVFRFYTMTALKERVDLSCPQKIYDYAQQLYQNQKIEQIYLLALDSRGRLQEQIELGKGTFDECKLSTRKLITTCTNIQTFNIYILHNHPSGTASPSIDDIEFTDWAKSAFEIMGINFIDHIIVGENSVFSFRKNNLMQSQEPSNLRGFGLASQRAQHASCISCPTSKVAKRKND
ncbi:MAG: JAB domain-containing protein [Clostridia bacterium]